VCGRTVAQCATSNRRRTEQTHDSIGNARRHAHAGARWQGPVERNFYGTVYCCIAVAPYMKDQRSGKIITTSSIAGIQAVIGGGYAHYSTAKASLKIYPLPRPGSRLTCNYIAPGVVATGCTTIVGRGGPIEDDLTERRAPAGNRGRGRRRDRLPRQRRVQLRQRAPSSRCRRKLARRGVEPRAADRITERRRVRVSVLSGKNAIITGAGRGLGRAYARKLAGFGARVAVVDKDLRSYRDSDGERDLMTADSTADEIVAADGQALGLECDVTDPGAQVDVAKQVFDRWGSIDILVANAGSGSGTPATTTASSSGSWSNETSTARSSPALRWPRT
jgi:NAD(P)-dependent dehydrogenase (short-subunit alcohol dehydrogenase family)